MAVTEADLAVDHELAEISGLLPYLTYVTPVNATEARRRFDEDGAEPEFVYRDLPDLSAIEARLATVEPDRADDPTVGHMARALKRELELRLDLIGSRGSPRFFLASVEMFGHVDGSLAELAHRILSSPFHDSQGPAIGAERLARLAREEIAIYGRAFPEIASRTEVRDDIAGIRVENGDVLIGSDVQVVAEHVRQLLHHEVGVHVLTYVNGSAQPLRMLAAGLAGYDENQEALGVLAEHLSGGLRPGRLRTLAQRVVAAQMRSDGAGFVDTHRRMVELGATPAGAFATAMRAHRSGGMTKDAVYLRGLVRLCDHLAADGELDTLFVGKIALEDEPLIGELAERGVLVDPPLRPRFLDSPATKRRLDEIRDGAEIEAFGRIAA